MSIVTDSSGERPENVYAIQKLFRNEAELEALYEEKKGKYKDLKEALIEDIEAFVAPMREKRNAITDDEVKQVLQEGKERSQAVSSQKLEQVRVAVGIAL